MANKRISYSQYSMWANCPTAWKLRYVDGHKFDDQSIHTIFGTSMHEVIQDWLDTLYNKSETLAKTVYLHDTFKEKLLALFTEGTTVTESGEKVFLADKKTLMEFYQHGCEILTYLQNNYKKIFPTENVKLHSIEFPLEYEVRPNVKYIGFIDIVTYDVAEGHYVLYDLKTSRSGWSAAEKKDPKKVGQLLLYKRFFSKQMGVDERSISVEFIILKRILFENSDFVIPRISKFVPPNGSPSVNKAWDSLTKFIDTCFDNEGNYITEQVANPSKDSCKWCVFKDRKDLCAYGV
jgi:hypothetical protein